MSGKPTWRSWTIVFNLGLIILGRLFPDLKAAVCGQADLALEIVCLGNAFLRFKTKEPIIMRPIRRYPFSHLLLLLALPLLLSGCLNNPEVRYDAAPAPIDENHLTLLLEGTCGDGSFSRGMGQFGCSWAKEEKAKGYFVVHTPLPGVVKITSKECGIEIADFRGEQGGSFLYDIATGNKGGPMLPAGITSCKLSIYVKWQPPKGMKKPEYELRGMLGEVYLRRRPEAATPLSMRWAPGGELHKGITWGQFREAVARSDERTSLELELMPPEKIVDGAYRLYGCGKGIENEKLLATSPSTYVIPRAKLLGDTYKKGGCFYYGYADGLGASGKWLKTDAVLAAAIYGVSVQHLAAKVTVEDGEVCYDTESAVSLAVLNYASTNKASNKLKGCFALPKDGNARLGLYTHKGRAHYTIIQDGQITESYQ
jgi:hypothetical protein